MMLGLLNLFHLGKFHRETGQFKPIGIVKAQWLFESKMVLTVTMGWN